MIAGKQDACAHNNALWCDAVLKAAGARTEFPGGYWCAPGRQLPLYPSVISLTAVPAKGLIKACEALPAGAAVKDSYDCLDLGPLGFRKLFTGTWLYRGAVSDRRPQLKTGWQKITHPEALRKWRAGWNGNESLHAIFPPSLLERRAIDFAALTRDGAITAGAVFNAGPTLDGKEIVGLSNVFCRRSWLYTALSELLAPYANRAVATYEDDDAVLPVYRQLGFEPCGTLAVWVRQ